MTKTKELYYWNVPVGTKVYDKNNDFIGTKGEFSSRPTATSTGHIEIHHFEKGTSWINGKAIYVVGMGLILI